jgi:phospholipid N-methyltransferase
MPPKMKASKQEAAQSRPSKSRSIGRQAPWFECIARPLAFFTLAALASPVSQATLAPVFGAIPSAVNHKEAVIATPLLAFLLRSQLKTTRQDVVAQYLAIWAFWIPVVEMYLFPFSDFLGPHAGPGILGFLSCHTIIIPAVYAAAEAIEGLQLGDRINPYLAAIFPTIAGVWHLVSFEQWFQTALPSLNSLSGVFTPVKVQILIASALAYLAPSKLILLALPALVHTFFLNPHFDSTLTFGILNTTLNHHNWAILDRRWSNTGYISVLESLDMQYRAMRCDHSLLGGEWLLTEERRVKEGWKTDEPIYSVFEILEAVRLIETTPSTEDASAQALVVGLGVGTTPKAFLAHGINTTIVEVDPVVHEFAMKYFNLPTNHTSILRDAVYWANASAAAKGPRYDYIIHDVFTGGAEPLALFTNKFLQDLRSLLKPKGLIALNYAGDLSMPLTRTVLSTIAAEFDDQCKIFRDTPGASDNEDDKASVNDDFTNIIVFCRNSPGAITFRNPTPADFLGSKSREHYMLPDPRLEVPIPDESTGMQGRLLLRPGEESRWTSHQRTSAAKHWAVMRRVIPAPVWELW